mmetsp:Transcript_27370/g.44552  ORF Transcript_27370/g.44552 Transcript_27370/m.44552 type:complete len:1085 (-) Transcript_27370:89-3343(-)
MQGTDNDDVRERFRIMRANATDESSFKVNLPSFIPSTATQGELARKNFGDASSLTSLRRACFKTMRLDSRGVQAGVKLSLTVVEHPPCRLTAWMTVVEDMNGDLCLLALYNCGTALKIAAHTTAEAKAAKKVLSRGAKLCIREPFWKLGQDGFPLLRVDDPETLVLSADISVAKTDLNDASKNLGASIKTDVDHLDHEALNDLGNGAFKEGDYSSAVDYYSKAIEKYATAKYHSNRAASYSKLDQWENAYNDGRAATLIDPNWARGYVRQGEALIGMQNYSEALKAYERALKLDPDDATVTSAITHCRAAQREKESDENEWENFEQRRNAQRLKDIFSPQSSQMGKYCELMKDPNFMKGARVMMETTPLVNEGLVCMHGSHGHPRDIERARKLFIEASEKGSPDGMFNLSSLLLRYGTEPKDFEDSHRWLERAAEQAAFFVPGEKDMDLAPGVVMAYNELGRRYGQGLNVKKDLVKAADWFRRAAETETGSSGNIHGMSNYGKSLLYGEGVTKNVPDALKWITKSAELGFPEAQSMLGRLYVTGEEGVPVDMAKGRHWLERAAAQGMGDALNMLSRISAPKEAHGHLKRAAETGKAADCYALGMAYLEGKDGTPQDDGMALLWIKKAAKGNYDVAQFFLGELYMAGGQAGVTKDPCKAVQWWQKAAEQGYGNAEYRLGHAYAYGIGVPKSDLVIARKWLHRAKVHGIGEAEDLLKYIDEGKVNVEESRKMLEEWEREMNISSEGMGMDERRERYIHEMEKKFEMPSAVCEKFRLFTELTKQEDPKPYHEVSKESYPLKELAKYVPGSKTAQDLYNAKLSWMMGLKNLLTGEDKQRGLKLMSEALKVEAIVCSPCPREMILAAMEDETSENALFLKAHCSTSTRSYDVILLLLKHCISLNPTEPAYHYMHGAILGFMKRYEESLGYYDEALRFSSRNAGYLYMKGTALALLSRADECIPILEEFLDRSEPDARKRANACFFIGQMHGMKKTSIDIVRKWYERGLQEDEKRFPLFEASADFPARVLVELALAAEDSKPKQRDSCAGCGKSNVKRQQCSKCRGVSYCGRECQISHWKTHKVQCRPHC